VSTGGVVSSGGVTGNGGTTSSGGTAGSGPVDGGADVAPGSGGSIATGGSAGNGGATSSGGVTSSGGATSNGGAPAATGGSSSPGGTTGSGGTAAAGGSGTGGASSQGGSAGTGNSDGGTDVAPDSGADGGVPADAGPSDGGLDLAPDGNSADAGSAGGAGGGSVDGGGVPLDGGTSSDAGPTDGGLDVAPDGSSADAGSAGGAGGGSPDASTDGGAPPDAGAPVDSGAGAGDAAVDAEAGVPDGGVVTGDAGVDAEAGAPVADGATGDAADGSALTGLGTCDTPYVIPMNVAHTDITVDTTTGRTHDFDFPCASNGTDVVLSFIVTQPEIVYADTFGASVNTALFFGDACDGSSGPAAAQGTASCNDDACGAQQSQATAVVDYGLHLLVVSGVGTDGGPVTVHFQHAQLGSGQARTLAAGSGTVSGTTGSIGAMNMCQASGGDDSYWWATCPSFAGGSFTASTCNGATFDTVLSLQVPRTNVQSCADDAINCGVQSTINTSLPAGAGVQVLTIDGATGSDKGPYTITYTRP